MKNRMMMLVVTLAVNLAACHVNAGILVYESSGASPSSIDPTVNAFRAALGGANNGGLPANFLDGRREINWDAAPDSVSDPSLFPGDFFNSSVSPRARGIEFSTPGTGLMLSSTSASGQPTQFGFSADFQTFSAERLFSPVGSNITDVNFFNPAATGQQATVSGLGVVFTDVEVVGSTSIQLFDLNGGLLFSRDVLTTQSGGLSFLGLYGDAGERIARARIISGNAVFLGNGQFGPGTDGVVMDDFIFGEPIPVAVGTVPEPNSLISWALLNAFLFIRRRRD